MLVNGLFHLLINGIYWGYNPLILTIDPNFQRDIQVSETSKWRIKCWGLDVRLCGSMHGLCLFVCLLVRGFTYFLFSPLFGEMIQFD